MDTRGRQRRRSSSGVRPSRCALTAREVRTEHVHGADWGSASWAAPAHGRPVEIATDCGPARGRGAGRATVEGDAGGGDRQARTPSPSHEERGGTTFFRQDGCGAKTPRKRMSGWRGGEMRAASRARKLHGLHHTMGLARPRLADRVRDPSVPEHAQPFEAERRTGAVAQEPLAPFAITRRHDDTGMHVEPSRVATASVRSRRDGQRHVIGVEGRSALGWQRAHEDRVRGATGARTGFANAARRIRIPPLRRPERQMAALSNSDTPIRRHAALLPALRSRQRSTE